MITVVVLSHFGRSKLITHSVNGVRYFDTQAKRMRSMKTTLSGETHIMSLVRLSCTIWPYCAMFFVNESLSLRGRARKRQVIVPGALGAWLRNLGTRYGSSRSQMASEVWLCLGDVSVRSGSWVGGVILGCFSEVCIARWMEGGSVDLIDWIVMMSELMMSKRERLDYVVSETRWQSSVELSE